jgi:hypothetical protein
MLGLHLCWLGRPSLDSESPRPTAHSCISPKPTKSLRLPCPHPRRTSQRWRRGDRERKSDGDTYIPITVISLPLSRCPTLCNPYTKNRICQVSGYHQDNGAHPPMRRRSAALLRSRRTDESLSTSTDHRSPRFLHHACYSRASSYEIGISNMKAVLCRRRSARPTSWTYVDRKVRCTAYTDLAR